MNRAKYDSLTSDLREVIDRNSGVALSGEIGKVFATGDAKAKDNMLRNSTINVIPSSELEGWKNVGQQVTEAWATEVTEKGRDGRKLLESARGLIRKHTGE
jgi:TRAP-type C4-dicarboxylate transport system substrate-binding protein